MERKLKNLKRLQKKMHMPLIKCRLALMYMFRQKLMKPREINKVKPQEVKRPTVQI